MTTGRINQVAFHWGSYPNQGNEPCQFVPETPLACWSFFHVTGQTSTSLLTLPFPCSPCRLLDCQADLREDHLDDSQFACNRMPYTQPWTRCLHNESCLSYGRVSNHCTSLHIVHLYKPTTSWAQQCGHQFLLNLSKRVKNCIRFNMRPRMPNTCLLDITQSELGVTHQTTRR